MERSHPKRGEATREAPWTPQLRATEAALARGDTAGAAQAWDEAYLLAVGGWQWQGLVEVGHAYLRIGEASGCREASEATARKAYFAALFRACQADSLDGILRIAGAFADLGDRQVVDECIGLAELVAGDDGKARARVRALSTQLADCPPVAG